MPSVGAGVSTVPILKKLKLVIGFDRIVEPTTVPPIELYVPPGGTVSDLPMRLLAVTDESVSLTLVFVKFPDPDVIDAPQ